MTNGQKLMRRSGAIGLSFALITAGLVLCAMDMYNPWHTIVMCAAFTMFTLAGVVLYAQIVLWGIKLYIWLGKETN